MQSLDKTKLDLNDKEAISEIKSAVNMEMNVRYVVMKLGFRASY